MSFRKLAVTDFLFGSTMGACLNLKGLSTMTKGLTLIFFVLLSYNAFADSFRCDDGIVKSGDSVNTLMNKCGNAQRTYRTYETVNNHGRRHDERVMNYVYERRGKKDMIVSVQNGVVIKIQPD